MFELPKSDAADRSAKHLRAPASPTERGESGKEGLDVSNIEFMAALITNLPDGAHSLVCSKIGDPGQGGWHAEDGSLVATACPPYRNNYVNCSSVYPDEDGKLAARKDHFAAYHFVLLDDVGTKVDRALLGDFVPTAELETSPGNSQVVIKLKEPITDQKKVSHLQRQLAEAGLKASRMSRPFEPELSFALVSDSASPAPSGSFRGLSGRCGRWRNCSTAGIRLDRRKTRRFRQPQCQTDKQRLPTT